MTDTSESTAGRLLVASPLIGDPNFERSVILMIEHTEESALGLVLSNPSDTPVAHMLPAWAPLVARPDVFFFGGPVSPQSVICLGTALSGHDETFHRVVGNVGTIVVHRRWGFRCGHSSSSARGADGAADPPRHRREPDARSSPRWFGCATRWARRCRFSETASWSAC